MRLLSFPGIAFFIVLLGCHGQAHVQCAEDGNCDLLSGGVCATAPSGNRWCAYPDPDHMCGSGLKYADEDTGEGLGGQCVERQKFTLSVVVGGSASGSVASTPDGITCAQGTCKQDFAIGAQVDLAATPVSGSFLGWSDACSGYAKCTVTMDRDKSVGALFGIPGQALWAQEAGSDADDVGRAIASDLAGNVVVVGEFHGSIQFGTTTLTSAGGADVFVVKFNGADGTVVWAKQVGGAMDDQGRAVAIDSVGNVYFTGTFFQTIDFGGGPIQSQGFGDAFIAKLSPTGDYIWARSIGGPDFNVGTAVAVHGNSVAVVGTYRVSATVDTMTISAIGSNDTGYIVKLATDGSISWMRSLGSGHGDNPSGVAIDGSDNVVVVGRFFEATDLGDGQIMSAGFDDIFVAKYAGGTGAHLFSKGFGTASFDYARSVAVDGSGNIIILGESPLTINVGGPTPLAGAGGFLVKYSIAGAYLWASSFGAPAKVTGSSIAVDTAGDVAITGQFCDTINFGGKPLTSVLGCTESDWDVFITRLSGTDGSHINSARAGGTGLDIGYGVTQLSDGRTFVAGDFQGFAEFGGRGLASRGGTDVFVLGLPPL